MNGLHCGCMNSSPRRWGLRESAAAVVVAAVIAALGGAAIYAATAGTSRTFGAAHRTPGSAGQHVALPPGPTALQLHGEFVVPNGAGGYTTELTQTGTVAAISAASVTVRSEDGYTQTYVIPKTANSATAPFAVDDQVVVRAARTGPTATVTNIGGSPPHRN
jgi:hypothetical protein